MSLLRREKGAYAPKGEILGGIRAALVVMAAACVLCVGSVGRSGSREAQAASKATKEQGAAVFRDKGCGHCHGPELAGTERGPNLQGVGRVAKKKEISRQIREGGKEMPAFGDSLKDEEVEQLVAFLSAQKKKGVKPVKAAPGAGQVQQVQ